MKKESKDRFPAYYCETSFIDVVLPVDEIKPDASNAWLIIGRPGVDGIEFRVKNAPNESTLYAFYPFEEEYVVIADSANDLVEKWKAGEIIL